MSDVDSSFIFSNGIFGDWFDLATLNMIGGTVVGQPLDTSLEKE